MSNVSEKVQRNIDFADRMLSVCRNVRPELEWEKFSPVAVHGLDPRHPDFEGLAIMIKLDDRIEVTVHGVTYAYDLSDNWEREMAETALTTETLERMAERAEEEGRNRLMRARRSIEAVRGFD